MAVAVRPWLWTTAVIQAVRLARPGWWRRSPFLPRPDPDYIRFRLRTAYGADGVPPPRDMAQDVVAYLRWCRDFPRREFPRNAPEILRRSK